MLNHVIKHYEGIVMLGKVFKYRGINCIYGSSGLGKTVSTVKALNEDDITPILLDFDNNNSPEENGCNYIHVDGKRFMASYSVNEAVIPRDRVIIIDTWAMFESYLKVPSNDKLLEDLSKDNTIIIIAHNKDIASKRDIPDVPDELINHWDSKLFLWFDEGSKTKSNPRPPSYNLTVMKLRSYKGERVLIDWMRD